MGRRKQMRSSKSMWVTFVCLLMASLGWSQGGPDRVCEVNATTPKPGSAKAFEQGRINHNKFHAAEKDKNSIMVWSVATGPGTGGYVTTVCGLTWKGLDGHDDFDKRDAADRDKTMAPTVAENEASYYVFRPDMSTGTEGGTPPKMITVVHYFVKPGGLIQFQEAVKKIGATITQNKYPAKPSRWYVLANGGKGPHYVQVTDRASWSDMQPPEKQLVDFLKESGDDKSLQSLREAVDHTVSELLEYRADLSYMPAK
jgi:hypothetical protein